MLLQHVLAAIIFLSPSMVANTKRTEKIEQYVNKQAQKHAFSGSILVAEKNEILVLKSYGCANYEHDVPNSPQTIFRIASITKPFTALAVMQLHEKKVLNIHDTITKYIPEFPRGEKITLHHLLTHTSGVANYNRCASKEFYESHSLEQLIAFIASWQLDFEPGSKYSYSNSGYILLTAVIEKVTGKKFEAYLQENIFKPLNMSASGFDQHEVVLKKRAQGYLLEKNVLKNIPYTNVAIPQGSGSLYASLEDMYTWDRALWSGRLVKQEMLTTIMAPHIAMEGSVTRAHGYGLFIDEYQGKKFVEYSGSLIGFQSKYIHFIEDDLTIIILSNVERTSFCEFCDIIVFSLFCVH